MLYWYQPLKIMLTVRQSSYGCTREFNLVPRASLHPARKIGKKRDPGNEVEALNAILAKSGTTENASLQFHIRFSKVQTRLGGAQSACEQALKQAEIARGVI
jgi:hypothetical protein